MYGITYCDRDGIPIDMDEFSRLYQDHAYKRVARSKVTDGADPSKSFDVSTVWLGFNHQFGDGPPVIFETMVFAEGSSMDEACERYSTEAEAKAGHTAMVVSVCTELTDPIVMDTA